MRHEGKVTCPSCPQAHRFLKLQPNSMTNSPSPGFAIAEKPEPISKAHSEFDFSPASAASKRTHLSMWGAQWLPGWAADTSPEPLDSPWRAGSSPCPEFTPQLPNCLVLGETKNTSWPKGHLLTGSLRWNLSPGRPSFWIEKGWVLWTAIFKLFLSNTSESI